ncbi:SDR family oxidoreductase [uncultured Desulfosarcina sp.]|uniref:SDR family oxidoreductase n=1 Tax=uncultured Desulfosarcina sp. TaxID=218289 RepID=UPI0029C6F9C1|nr:SDR family oxidoreductase [uncultured Desulfosarcina sp.]
MKNILITGVSGYIGTTLAKALLADDHTATVVGTDLRNPSMSDDQLIFYRHDVRDPMGRIMADHAIDTVVHAAYVLPPLHDTALMESINVEGTRNVLEASARTGVRQLLVTSSTTAYGFHADNPIPLTENDPLRGNADFTYAKNKREIEGIIGEFSDAHPRIGVTVLRPCFVVGPNMNNPLSDHLKKPLVVLPKETMPLQFVHETDLTRAILHCLTERFSGIFNIAGAGTLTVAEMVAMMGNRPVWVPCRLLYPLNRIAWALRLHGLTRFPSPALGLFRYSWVADPQKFIRQTGFAYRYDTRQAFADFARHAG